jgi:cyclase
MPLAYGGGVSSLGTIERLIHGGVEKVILNTAAVERPSFVEEAAREFGTSTIVAALDVRSTNGVSIVYSRGGSLSTGQHAAKLAKELCERGAGEIFVQSIERDGTRQGYDLELISSVARAVSISVVACGGAGNVADLRAVLDLGCSAAAGSLFVLYGRLQSVLITYPTASELGRQEDVWP